MTGFFTGCRTAADIKKAYYKWARKLHPDNNPGRDTTEDMKQLNAEYDRICKAFTAGPSYESERDYQERTRKEQSEQQKATSEDFEAFREMVERLLRIPGIGIEICGSWIWVSGNTKAVKEDLKAAGMRWSRNKAMWYWHEGPYRRRGKSWSMDQIRERHGSRVVRDEEKAS